MKSICLVPARANSKRIKNKNIISFFGKPIIYWPLLASKKSKLFDDIIVSSNGDKIIKAVKKLKFKYYKRDSKLSGDNVPLIDVIKDFVIKNNFENYKVCCVLAANPMIDYKDLIKSSKLLNKKNKFVMSITEYDYPYLKALKMNKKFVYLKNKNTTFKNSQKLKPFFHDAGQFYWGKGSDFLKYRNIFDSKSVYGYYIKNSKCRDIDNLEDLKIAKALFAQSKKRYE